MIPNIGTQAVKLSRMAANELEYKEFMRRRHNRLMYYNAETDDLTREWFSKNLLKNVPLGNINITKRVIDRISQVYMVEAKRFFEGKEKATDKYKLLTPKKHERMQRIERMTNLLDVVAIHPFWNDKKKILDHNIILEFMPQFDEYGDMVGIRYPIIQSPNQAGVDEQTFVEWGLDGWRIVDMNGIESKAEQYKGIFPFSLSWTEEREYFYDHNPTADLAQGNLCINFFQTCLNGNIGFQSFGQPYVTGLQADQTIEWGIDKVPALPEGATAGMLSPPKTAADIVLVKQDLYKTVAKNYHLSEDFVQGSSQPESAVALKARGQELQNERKGDVIRSRNLENDIFAIERDQLAKVGISMPDVLSTDFSESVEYYTAQEQREKDDWDLAHNLITLRDIAMRQNQDLDEAEADKLIMENAQANSAVKKVDNGRINIVEDIFGRTGNGRAENG
jgi:hypothetical protein